MIIFQIKVSVFHKLRQKWTFTESFCIRKTQSTNNSEFHRIVHLIFWFPEFSYDQSDIRAKQNTSAETHQREILQLAWRECWNIDASRSLWDSLGRRGGKWAILAPAVLAVSLSVCLCVFMSEAHTAGVFVTTCADVFRCVMESMFLLWWVGTSCEGLMYGKKWKAAVAQDVKVITMVSDDVIMTYFG